MQTHLAMMLPVAARASWTARAPACSPPPPTRGRRQAGATASITHQQTAPHPNQSSRPWPSLPDKSTAGISHGCHPILRVSHTAREGCSLIRAVVPLPGEKHHSLHLGTGGCLGEVAMYNNHYGNMPLWFRAQVSQFEGQIGKARAADLNLSSP